MSRFLNDSEVNEKIAIAAAVPSLRVESERHSAEDARDVLHKAQSSSRVPVAQIVFGVNAFFDGAAEQAGTLSWPLLWLQGDVCTDDELTGSQTFYVDGAEVRSIVQDGRVVGSCWQDDEAEYALLAGILPAELNAAPGLQTSSVFARIEEALAGEGFAFAHVARTWLYLDKLLDWYDEFNVARTEFFETRGVFGRFIPASTGIGASNPFGAALTAGALAIKAKHNGVKVREVASPLQCEATEYRSSFSRAVEIELADRRYLTISGTASIAPGGASMHDGDVAKQIETTLDVVEAILASKGYAWSDTVRAIGYFRKIEDLAVFDRISRERGIAPLPLAPAHTIVCRDDLLFEIELDAAMKK